MRRTCNLGRFGHIHVSASDWVIAGMALILMAVSHEVKQVS